MCEKFGTVLQLSTRKRIGPNKMPKIFRVPRLPPGGSLGTGKGGIVPKNVVV